MDSRPILKGSPQKIGVYLDSNTFEELLNRNDRLATAILVHSDSEYLEFVRSPLDTVHNLLKDTPEYEFELDSDSEIRAIKIPQRRSIHAFGYRMNAIRPIAQKIYEKEKVSQNELDKIITVFVQAVFNSFEKTSIYITNDRVLLKNRLWFESHFPGGPLNIFSVEEASGLLDLFFKKNERYYLRNRFTLNKGYWYWLSMRLKLPHYNVGDAIIDALAFRFYYALMALDEIGIQFYLGVNNDTMDNTLYHFNYLVTLTTGMFDNLALKTNSHLNINFSDLRKVSLSNKSGRGFLGQIREKRPDIRDHIASYMNFIMLIYLFRELVVHREGLGKITFAQRGGWNANFVEISKEMKDRIKMCGDSNSDIDPISQWGCHNINSVGMYLEPYHFSTMILRTQTKFVDRYLELLGYPSFVEVAKGKMDDFGRTLASFEKFHLGF